MNLYNKIIDEIEAKAFNLSPKYQIGTAKEFSFFELLFGRLMNVCPHKFPAPAPGTIIDNRHLFNPVRNQGQEGACVEFAATGWREALFNLKNGDGKAPVLSPADLYWTVRDLPILSKWLEQEDTGATPRRALHCLKYDGVCLESLMPYVAGDFSQAPSAEAVAGQAQWKINNAYRVVPYDPEMLLSVLNSGRPILLAITVFESFENPGPGGLLTIPDVQKEAYMGNHGVVLVGADLIEKLWIVRNSWGTDWGDNGYCYMPFGYEQLWLSAWSADPG